MKLYELKLLLKEIAKQVLKENSVGIKYWWMTPNYDFIEVPFEQHRYWAETYLKKRGYVVDDKSDVYKMMHNVGFVRVVKMNYNGDIVLSYSHPKGTLLNSKQIKELRDWAIEQECHYIADDTTRKETRLQENANEEFKAKLIKSRLPHLTDDTVVVTVQRSDELPEASYVQVDEFSDGDNYFSSNPETMNKLGYKMPSTQELLKLPQGRYSMKRVKEIFAKYTKESINENMSYSELLALTDKTPRSPDDGTNRIERSRNVRVRNIPVSVEEGLEQWNFRYKSAPRTGNPGLPLEGHITFLKGDVSNKDSAEDLDVKVDCSCRDYKYKFAHNNYKQGASDIGPNSLNGAINRPPKPAYDIGQGLCKHLTALSKYLQTQVKTSKPARPSNLFEAIGEVAKRGPFTITYYD